MADLEAEFARALADQEPPSTGVGAAGAPTRGQPGALRLLDLSFDLVGVGGASSAREPELRSLQGGGHDPKNHGFTIQNVELTFSGVVDPYLRGDANVVLLVDEEGETVIELEEAYLTSLDLPFNLQIKAGQFFTDFGRLNPVHPHAWDFVDQPVVSSRLLGPDGVRGPGAQLSWLTPLPFFAELVLGLQNAQGETAPSFRGVPGESVAGRTLAERDAEGLGDLLYSLRLETSFDAGEAITLVPGLSALLGPNASDADARTEVFGADLYVKWKPLLSDHGWPFLAWQSEAMLRRYEAGPAAADGGDGTGEPLAGPATLDDFGLYSQLAWGFARPWIVAARYDYARGQTETFGAADGGYDSALDPGRDRRQRFSLALTHHPSEFSKLRLQYNYDRAQFLGPGDSHAGFLQFEILFGAHGAHQF